MIWHGPRRTLFLPLVEVWVVQRLEEVGDQLFTLVVLSCGKALLGLLILGLSMR